MYEKAIIKYNQAAEFEGDEEVFNAISHAENMLTLWRSDDYFVLGLPRPSTIPDVIKAMKKLSKAYHPDRFIKEDDKISHREAFKRITEAKENLVLQSEPDHEWVADT